MVGLLHPLTFVCFLVLCANKAILDSNPSLEDMLRPVVGPDAVLVLIQNGIGQEDALREAFPTTTIIASTVCIILLGNGLR